MFDMIAEVVIGLLKSLYGLSVSVVSGVINTVVTGTLIVRQTGGTAGTNEVQISENGTNTLIAPKQGNLQIIRSADGATSFISDGNNSIHRFGSGQIVFCTSATLGTVSGGFTDLLGGVVGMYNSGGNGGWIQNTSGEKRRTATQTVTDSATFAADDTLSITVISGRKYRFLLEYFFTTVNTSGVKVDLNGGSAAMTAINGMAFLYSSAGAVGNALQITALTSSPALTASGTFAYVTISGSFQPSGNGTFIPRFAQNAETGAAESVIAQIGSYITLADVP